MLNEMVIALILALALIVLIHGFILGMIWILTFKVLPPHETETHGEDSNADSIPDG